MRILILARHLSSGLGGIEIQCDLIARHLIRGGHSVLYGSAAGLAPPATLPYEMAEWEPGDSGSLERLIDRFRPDLVYLRHNKRKLRVTARTAERRGVPVVFAISSLQDVQKWSYHYSGAPVGPRRVASIAWQALKNRWNWTGFRSVRGVVSLNPDYLRRAPVARAVHIPDSMESGFEPFAWPRPYFAWVAQLKDYKRPEAFVELSARLEGTGYDFLMIGAVAHRRYQWIADAQGTPRNFHYLGTMSPREVNGVLRSAVALVHTCRPEGFGNNFIQAWQQGTPTYSLEFDPAGVIGRFELGSVPGSVDGLARELRLLAEHPERRAEISRRALVHAREYDPERNVARLAEFFAEVLEAERRR